MWNSFAKLGRLRKALEYRGIDSTKMDIGRLLNEMSRRMPDRRLSSIVSGLLSGLEPPVCHMNHCKHFGNQSAFCHCNENRIPGRCKIYRDYLKRIKARSALTKAGEV